MMRLKLGWRSPVTMIKPLSARTRIHKGAWVTTIGLSNAVPLASVVAGVLGVSTLVGAGTAQAGPVVPAWGVQTLAQPTSFNVSDTHQATFEVWIAATGGSFQVQVGGESSALLPWNATATEVEAAINGLPALVKQGASATVTGGPGDEDGTKPYRVAIGNGKLTGREPAFGIFAHLQGPGNELKVVTVDEGSTSDKYVIVPRNVGSRTSGGEITVTDTLPTGVTLVGSNAPGWACSTGGVLSHEVVTCTSEEDVGPSASAPAITLQAAVRPGAAPVLMNQVRVTGGGAVASITNETETVLNSAPTTFGLVDGLSQSLLDAAGMSDNVAGDHPNAQLTTFAFPTTYTVIPNGEPRAIYPTEEVKRIVIDLPPGVVGDALAATTCSPLDVASLVFNPQACPASSRVGGITLIQANSGGVEPEFPVYNVAPEKGYPAEFAVFEPNLKRAELLYASVVGSGADTHVRITSAPQSTLGFEIGISAVFFGHPGVINGGRAEPPINLGEPAAFFTNPSDCSASGFTSAVHVDSWEHPGRMLPDGQPDFADPNWKVATSTAPPVTGCEALSFAPTLNVQPTNTAPDAPTGLSVDLAVPQNETPSGLATPPLKDATVALPRGLVISPSAANGLQACSDEQFASATNDPATCPAASQIGTVTLHTPILAQSLEGQVFLGAPECSPCGNADAQSGRLARLFIQIHSERYGITLKIPGSVSIDPVSGQLTATFKNNPQQPFDDLKLNFPEGPRATLATPSACGTYTTTSDLIPWSSPQTPDATPPSSFQVGPCSADSFAPSFTAGTQDAHANTYSPLTLTFSRNDTEQAFSGLEQVLPAGVLAKLAGVAKCGDAEAEAGSCPAASRVGTVTVGAGPGSSPFYTTGSAYLTGPYNGGPFGVAVIVQAVAGPFNLGTVVVRNSIRVNPATAQATVVSDPFPNMLAGIPLQIRRVNVTLEREAFTFNATNCAPASITGKLVSTDSAVAPIASPYQASDCAGLAFRPKLSAITAGRSSKVGGASLDVRLSASGGPRSTGAEANIKSVKVDLPKQLPSRGTTLQKACLAKVFEANPASCPKESDVGTASATTPVLVNPLSGPAYLVSHGGAAFPDLEIVLQGEGIVLVLDGQTNIKKGITSSTFETVPDAPISSFELKLPTGKFSILSPNLPVKANFSFCGQKLTMPTKITAQNGAVLKQTTKIAISGCPKAKGNKRK